MLKITSMVWTCAMATATLIFAMQGESILAGVTLGAGLFTLLIFIDIQVDEAVDDLKAPPRRLSEDIGQENKRNKPPAVSRL